MSNIELIFLAIVIGLSFSIWRTRATIKSREVTGPKLDKYLEHSEYSELHKIIVYKSFVEAADHFFIWKFCTRLVFRILFKRVLKKEKKQDSRKEAINFMENMVDPKTDEDKEARELLLMNLGSNVFLSPVSWFFAVVLSFVILFIQALFVVLWKRSANFIGDLATGNGKPAGESYLVKVRRKTEDSYLATLNI